MTAKRRSALLRCGAAALVIAAAALSWTDAAAQEDGMRRNPPPRGRAAIAAEASCDRCHGELEFLRQHTDSLAEARALLAPSSVLRLSAHSAMSCAECHRGFTQYPHEPASGATKACSTCHESADTAWHAGAHGDRTSDKKASCSSCHGVHDVLGRQQLAGDSGVVAMNGRCVSCHQAAKLPRDDPHAERVACSSCHGSHDVRLPDTRAGTLVAGRQQKTCGACHEAAASDWHASDIHSTALAAGISERAKNDRLLTKKQPPTCTSCHGAHGMRDTTSVHFVSEVTARCGGCHEGYSSRFRDSYHGKAVELGSRSSATCWDCHGSHSVLPKTDPRSSVAEGNLIATCSVCHEHARAGFVKYDPHPNPLDRERNPVLFYAFVFMNSILFGTLGLFGLHTALWWVRLKIDRRRGNGHGGHS